MSQQKKNSAKRRKRKAFKQAFTYVGGRQFRKIRKSLERPGTGRRSRSRKTQRNPTPLKRISKSTGWKNAPGGSQVKFKRNKGKIEVYLRSKPRRKTTTKRRK